MSNPSRNLFSDGILQKDVEKDDEDDDDSDKLDDIIETFK